MGHAGLVGNPSTIPQLDGVEEPDPVRGENPKHNSKKVSKKVLLPLMEEIFFCGFPKEFTYYSINNSECHLKIKHIIIVKINNLSTTVYQYRPSYLYKINMDDIRSCLFSF